MVTGYKFQEKEAAPLLGSYIFSQHLLSLVKKRNKSWEKILYTNTIKIVFFSLLVIYKIYL